MSVLQLLPKRKDESLRDAWLDFKLARQVMDVSPQTLQFYDYTAGKFVEWLGKSAGLASPAELRTQHVRHYQVGLKDRGLSAGARAAHARAIRALVNFWQAEAWIPDEVSVVVDLPKVPRERLPMVTEEIARKLLAACETNREKALIYLLLDTGIRRGEACNLNWEDVNLGTGMVNVRQGKGKKDRSVVVGPTTRRALLRYRRQVEHEDGAPLFQSERGGGRLTGSGLRGIVNRIAERARLKVTVHAFRRGFATLSLRSGMQAFHLQALLGHASLEMVRRYVQLVDDDLKTAHEAHSPVERWLT